MDHSHTYRHAPLFQRGINQGTLYGYSTPHPPPVGPPNCDCEDHMPTTPSPLSCISLPPPPPHPPAFFLSCMDHARTYQHAPPFQREINNSTANLTRTQYDPPDDSDLDQPLITLVDKATRRRLSQAAASAKWRQGRGADYHHRRPDRNNPTTFRTTDNNDNSHHSSNKDKDNHHPSDNHNSADNCNPSDSHNSSDNRNSNGNHYFNDNHNSSDSQNRLDLNAAFPSLSHEYKPSNSHDVSSNHNPSDNYNSSDNHYSNDNDKDNHDSTHHANGTAGKATTPQAVTLTQGPGRRRQLQHDSNPIEDKEDKTTTTDAHIIYHDFNPRHHPDDEHTGDTNNLETISYDGPYSGRATLLTTGSDRPATTRP